MPDPEPSVAPLGLVERLRAVHLQMVDAVLGGEGLERVAELAAGATGGSVAIVVPRDDVAVASPANRPAASVLGALRRSAVERAGGPPARSPDGVVGGAPVARGDEPIGPVALGGAPD